MDTIFERWLRRQAADAAALAAASDVVSVLPEPGAGAPRRFIVEFANPTLVSTAAGIERVERFAVLLRFPPDYLRVPYDAAKIVSLLAPENVFHPNARAPFICTGRLAPGTELCELIYQVNEILTFVRFTPREDDALNHAACEWARHHMDRFPLDARPLRRRAPDWSLGQIAQAEASL